jgi:small subunit ribosomal protein S9
MATKTKATAAAPAKKMQPLTQSVGRRKSAIAREWLRRGSGALIINGKDYKNYFETDVNRAEASSPFRIVPVSANYDIEANVAGGGLCAQAGAVKVGIARALVAMDDAVRSVLRQHGMLTMDSRRKERKKYGQKAARRKFQFVKR